MLVAAASPAYAETEAETARAQLATLPGMNLLDGKLALKSASPGYTIEFAKSSPVSATVFKSDAGWNGSLELTAPGDFQFDELAGLGAAETSAVVIVAAAQADQIASDKLPAAIRSDLEKFFVAKKLDVAAGLNVFVTGTVKDTGVLGQLKAALGATTEAVRIRGTIGEGAIKRMLGAATSKTAAADPTQLSLSVTFPKLVPPALDTPVSRLEATTSTLTWASNAGTTTITGTIDGSLTIASTKGTFTGKLTVTGTGDAQRLVLEATTSLSVKNLFDIAGVDLTKVGTTMSATSDGSFGFVLDLGVKVGSKSYTGRFATRFEGGQLTEVSVAIDGSFKLPMIRQAFGEDLTMTNPSIGVMPATSAVFIGGTVTWRDFTTTAVVYIAAAGSSSAAAFIKLGNVDLQKVVKSDVPLAKIDKAIAIVSTSTMAALPVASLPSPARAMIDELGAVSVTPTSGLSLLGKFRLSATIGKPLGISGSFLVGGSIGTDGTFALYADLPTFTVPSSVQGAGLPSSIKPKVFIALRADRSFQLGVAVGLTFKLEASRELAADGEFYVGYGAAGGSVSVKGMLRSNWVDPFGLTGITIGAGTGLLLSGATDGSVKMLAKGTVTFGANTLELGGGVSLLFSTGVPTVKGFAFKFSATELGLTTPVEIGQVLLRASISALDPSALSKDVARDLATAANADLVALLKAAMPDSKLAQFSASLKVKNPLLFIATPGMGGGDPDFAEFDDAGVMVKGALVMGTKELGAIDFYATMNRGLSLAASVADFSLGDLDVRDASIDLGAGIPGLQNGVAPHFAITGAAKLDGRNLGANVDISISAQELRVEGAISVFGSSVAMAGEMYTKTTYGLTGSATLDIPGEGEVAGVDVGWTQDGVHLDCRASYSGVRFDLSGNYRSKSDWSISGKLAVDTSTTIDLATGDIKVKVKGSVTWKLSDDGVSIRFKGYASGTIAGVPTKVSLDEKVSAGKITFDFGVYKKTVTVVD